MELGQTEIMGLHYLWRQLAHRRNFIKLIWQFLNTCLPIPYSSRLPYLPYQWTMTSRTYGSQCSLCWVRSTWHRIGRHPVTGWLRADTPCHQTSKAEEQIISGICTRRYRKPLSKQERLLRLPIQDFMHHQCHKGKDSGRWSGEKRTEKCADKLVVLRGKGYTESEEREWVDQSRQEMEIVPTEDKRGRQRGRREDSAKRKEENLKAETKAGWCSCGLTAGSSCRSRKPLYSLWSHRTGCSFERIFCSRCPPQKKWKINK